MQAARLGGAFAVLRLYVSDCVAMATLDTLDICNFKLTTWLLVNVSSYTELL